MQALRVSQRQQPFQQVHTSRGAETERNKKLATTTASANTAPTGPEAHHKTSKLSSQDLHNAIMAALDDAKAEDLVEIPLTGKSAIGDHMVVASGRSQRHVGSIADQIERKLKDMGHGRVRVEGLPACDWVLIDAGDVIVHVFRPEVREFYNLEKMWLADRPQDADAYGDPLAGDNRAAQASKTAS